MDVPIGVLMIGVVWVSNTTIYMPNINRITVTLKKYTYQYMNKRYYIPIINCLQTIKIHRLAIHTFKDLTIVELQ